jgi:hypothetical protein
MYPSPIRLAAVAAGFLLTLANARAESITLVMEDAGTRTTYSPYGGAPTSVGVGPFQWSQPLPLNANYPSAVTTYCIDLDQFFYPGTAHQFTVQSNLALAPTIGSADRAAPITELFDRYYQSSLTTTADATAFQLALWELVYDGDERSLGAGRIQSDNAQAQAMLNSLGTPYSNHDLAGHQLTAFVSDVHQDQIGVTPAAVPAPPAVLLAGFGLLVLVGRARLNRTGN